MVKSDKATKNINQTAPAGGFYLLAYIGAAIYFVNQADGFWEVVLALLQSLVWPAFLIHGVFTALQI